MSTKPKIDVVVDTNIIYTGETGRFLMTKSFKDAIAKLVDRAEITVHIPEMVFEEIFFQKRFALVRDYKLIQVASNRIERLVSTNVNLRHKLDSLERMLRRALLRDSTKPGYRLLKFALPSGRWKELAQAVVRREPPFDEEGEAAYRDAVIRAQAHEFATKQKGTITVFLVADDASRSAAAGLQDGKRFIVLPSTEALTALVDDLTSNSAQRLKEVRIMAAKLFAGWKDGLFIKWNINGKIESHVELTQPLRITKISPFTFPGQFLYSSELAKYPPFRHVEGGTEVISFDEARVYKFQSKVSYIYHREAGYAIGGLTLERRQVEATIDWSARLDQGALSDAKLGETKIVGDDKSTFFVGLPSPSALSIGPTGATGPTTFQYGQSGPLSLLGGPLVASSRPGLASLMASASGSSGLFSALDPYAKFTP